MTHWFFDPASNAGTLSISEDLTIHHVGDLKACLVEAFSRADQVTVDVSAATAVDVAGVQLLCACHRFSSGRGQSMRLQYGDNRMFRRFLDAIGFSLTCDGEIKA